MARVFEDFVIGETWESGSVTLSEDEMIRYARENDPQPIHIDPVASAGGRFGGIIASGWQVAALSMKLFIQAGGYGDTPVLGMGIDELRWRRPVRPGDRLRVVREVVGLERPPARPGFGIIRTRVTVMNQHDEAVLTMVSIGQVPARAPAPA